MKSKNIGGRIAVTVWENRISPVFDSARTLLITDIKDKVLVSVSYLAFDLDHPLELLQMLRAEKVKTIICGAISEEPANMLLAAGFELISFIAGDVHQLLETFVRGEPLGEDFKMPGCGRNICCRGKIRHGWEIGTMPGSGRRGRGRREQSAPAVGQKGEGLNDSARSAEMSARFSGKS